MPPKGINGRANMQKYQMNSKKYGGNPFKFTSLEGSRGRIGRGMWNVIQRRTEPVAAPVVTAVTPTWTDGSLKDSNFNKAIDWWIEGGEYKDAVILGLGIMKAWNTSAVTNMSSAFDDGRDRDVSLGGTLNSANFDEDIDDWDVSSVTNMAEMFKGAASFGNHQDMEFWDVGNVTDMRSMFEGALAFNGGELLTRWHVDKVEDMSSMFKNASSFLGEGEVNSPWDVSSVTNMSSMFNGAILFMNDLSDWDVSSVTNMSSMFEGAIAFDEPATMGDWDVTSVEDMSFMFKGATAFTGDGEVMIDDWVPSSVTNMESMFEGATLFSVSLKNWEVEQVLNMTNIFNGAVGLAVQDWSGEPGFWKNGADNIAPISGFYSGGSNYVVGSVPLEPPGEGPKIIFIPA